MVTRHPKFLYGPMLGFLMGVLFSRGSAKSHYDLWESWYHAEKPPHYNDEEHSSVWHPAYPYVLTTPPVPHGDFPGISAFGDEPAAAASNARPRWRPHRATKKRRVNSKQQKRRRRTTTTTEAYYYDDDYSEEYEDVPRRPVRGRRTTTPAYDDYGDYSLEVSEG